jgi:hypothetical protein
MRIEFNWERYYYVLLTESMLKLENRVVMLERAYLDFRQCPPAYESRVMGRIADRHELAHGDSPQCPPWVSPTEYAVHEDGLV